MNDEITNNLERPVWHIGVIFFATCLVFGALVLAVKFSTPVPAIDADRGTAISTALAEISKTENAELNTVGWADESRGVVRLPIDTAIQIMATKGSAAAVRANLTARAEKAANTAPKKPVEKPNAFE